MVSYILRKMRHVLDGCFKDSRSSIIRGAEIFHTIFISDLKQLVSWPPTVYILSNPSPKPVYSSMWDGGALT